VFKTNYKATLKTLFRSPITLIAFGTTLLLAYSLRQAHSFVLSMYDPTVDMIRSNIRGDVETASVYFFAAFTGILISAFLLSDKQNGFSDLIVSSRKSMLSIYVSRLCAIATVSLLAHLIVLFANAAWYWFVHYPSAGYIEVGAVLPLGKILAHYAVVEVILMPFVMLYYIAMSVFVCAVTNIPVAGGIWNVVYYLTDAITPMLVFSNYYMVPFDLFHYIMAFEYVDDLQYLSDMLNGRVLLNYPLKSLPEVLTIYFGWIAFALALLTASYFILKRRYRT